MGGMSIVHWIIVLVIVVLIFGTKRLPNIGKDLGDAFKGFKKGLSGEETPAADAKKKLSSDESKPDDDKTA